MVQHDAIEAGQRGPQSQSKTNLSQAVMTAENKEYLEPPTIPDSASDRWKSPTDIAVPQNSLRKHLRGAWHHGGAVFGFTSSSDARCQTRLHLGH